MEQKKISFGFNKLSKKLNIISHNVKQDAKKVELIDCLEGQSIRVKDAVEEVNHPLVIPIKDNHKNLLDRVRDAKKRDMPLDENKIEPKDNRPDSELTIDELAARQLIREAKDRLAQRNNKVESKVSVLPLNHETPTLEGEKEPTLEDYESVPISDYGLALLRGMGWKEGMTVGKRTSKTVTVSAPELRPKGLGLGATKVVQSEIPAKKSVDKDGKELVLIKGAYAKLIAGVKKGNYCEVQGFDEDAGRVIVKVYPAGDNLTVNEFMVIPVTKEEFSKGYKILNNAKYEEYLEISEKKLEKYKIKQESLSSKNIKEEHPANPNFDSEEYGKGSTTNKKYKESPRSSDEKDTHIRQKDSHKRNKRKSESSDSEYETEKKHRNHTKSKYKDRSRSRSQSRHKSKKDKTRRRSDSSSDLEYNVKEKKSSKHSKSKYQEHSRDEKRSREKHKDKKHKSKRDTSSSESDSRRDKRKKNKCKSRHRRNSSSSSTDKRSYRNKK